MERRLAARRFAFFVALLLAARGAAVAQIALRPSDDGHGFAFNVGIARTRSGTVSDRTFDPLSKRSLDLGAAVYFAHRGFLLGPEVAWVSASPDSSGGASRLHAGDVMLDAGRIVRVSHRAAIYPLLGLGWGWNDVRNENPSSVTQRGAPGSFDAAISEPNTSKHFRRNAVVTSLGAAAQFYFLLRGDGNGGEHGLFVGLRSGIRLTHDLGAWTESGQSLRGGPTTALAGPFIQLSLGPAAWSRPRNQGVNCPTC